MSPKNFQLIFKFHLLSAMYWGKVKAVEYMKNGKKLKSSELLDKVKDFGEILTKVAQVVRQKVNSECIV